MLWPRLCRTNLYRDLASEVGTLDSKAMKGATLLHISFSIHVLTKTCSSRVYYNYVLMHDAESLFFGKRARDRLSLGSDSVLLLAFSSSSIWSVSLYQKPYHTSYTKSITTSVYIIMIIMVDLGPVAKSHFWMTSCKHQL